MPLPVQQFALPNFTPGQISPVMTGIGQANTLYQQSMQNKYMQPDMQAALRKQQLSNQITQAQANVAPQMNAAQLAYNQAKTPNLNAATQYLLSGQIPEAQAQASYLGTNAAKNQFNLSHPSTMLPGMAGQIGSLAILKNLINANRAGGQAPPSPIMNSGGTLPGIPSAGNDFLGSPGSTGNNGAPILPPNPYGNPNSSLNPPQIGIGNGGVPVRNAGGQPISANSGNSIGGMATGTDGLPSTPDLINFGLQSFMAPMEKNIAQADLYNKKTSGFNFQSLPPTEKSYMIAQAAGIGIDPLQAANDYNNGATLASLAQQQGLDPNNLPPPLYAPDGKSIAQIQLKNQARNEINTIMPIMTNAIAPYSRRFNGFSPSQISQAISNDAPDAQAQFLAAKALMPEMSALRTKAMGGNVGIEAIKEITNSSMGNIKSFQGLVSPKVYSSAQGYVDKWINQGADAANRVGLAGSVGNLNIGGRPLQPSDLTGTGTPQNTYGVTSQATQTPAYAPNATVQMFAPNGEKISVLGSNVSEAIKRGAKLQ